MVTSAPNGSCCVCNGLSFLVMAVAVAFDQHTQRSHLFRLEIEKFHVIMFGGDGSIGSGLELVPCPLPPTPTHMYAMHTRTHTYTHTCTHTRTYTHMHTHARTHTHTLTHTCTDKHNAHTHMYTTQRQGHGKLTFAAGKGWYEGSWESDLRHGRGKQMYPNGDLYEGGWELNKV